MVVIFVLNLPDGQVLFFWEIQITEGLLSILSMKKGFGAGWNDLWASTCYLQFARLAGCKTDWLSLHPATLYRCRYRRLCSLNPGPHLGRKTQVLATPLGLSRNLWTILSSLVLPGYPGPKHKHSISNLIFRVISFTAFCKFLGHGNSSWFSGG